MVLRYGIVSTKLMKRFEAAYVKCEKVFFGFARLDSVSFTDKFVACTPVEPKVTVLHCWFVNGHHYYVVLFFYFIFFFIV